MKLNKKLAFLIIISCLLITFYSVNLKPQFFELFDKELKVSFDDWKELKKYFEEIGYTSIKNPPKIIVKSLPKNLKDAPVNIRKELFVKIMIPLIKKVNEEILNEREEILKAKINGNEVII